MLLAMYQPDQAETGELLKAKNPVAILGLGETLEEDSYLTLARSPIMILTKMTTVVTKIIDDLY